ncbi:YkgJ family cysteine cluster protein [Pseudomonas sp. Pseu.R1]|uniref:YkgJ family cysteine cluster protein n=1 Tax=Pseudomonas sp. Pseu.R1 TaxID=3379818 RepID=UPI003B94205A
MKSPIQFECTMCGTCCRNRLIPLTVSESIQWLKRGHRVAVLTEAFSEDQWVGTGEEYRHQLQRSFEVKSNDRSVRVIVILAADALTKCPNLEENNGCAIYADRPHVCRIYPLEINPFIQMRPENKCCPPEAWSSGNVIYENETPVDENDRLLIASSRSSDRRDASMKSRLSQSLGLNAAAWKGDGLMSWNLDPAEVLRALLLDDSTDSSNSWAIYSQNENLARELTQRGILTSHKLPQNAHYYSLTSSQ